MLKAILFDLDGTLLNTLDDITLVMNDILKQFDCPLHGSEEYRWLVGRGLHNLVYDALPETKKDLAETVYKEAHAIFAQRGVGTATLYPGVMETLDTLKLAGIALAVVSNKPHEAVGAIIDELGIREYFVGVYGGQRHIPLKPHPESIQPAIETVQKLIPHCNLSEIALLGDSNVDMETAHNAHIVPLGAGWGFRGVQELTEAGASVILMSIKELIPLLGLI